MVLGLALSGPAIGADIEVVHETILERGVYADAKAIARMTDGGYVIAGSIPGIRAGWATKVDAKGNPQWRYVLPPEKPNPDGLPPAFTAVAAMPDGGALLCGYTATGAGPISTANVGVLVRMDTAGKVLGKQILYPKGDERLGGRFEKCTNWDGGFAVVGHAGRSYWVMAVNADIGIRWEKLVPIGLDNTDDYSRPLVLPNQDLVFSATRRGGEILTEVVRVNLQGEVQAQRKLLGHFFLVQPSAPDSVILLMACHYGPRRGTLLRIGTKLEEIEAQAVDLSSGHICRGAYMLSDRSLVLFGHSPMVGRDMASIIKKSPLLRAEKEYLFPPRHSWWIDDAVPTGNPGEFATVRKVQPPSYDEANRNFQGTGLTIIRIK
ncbi:MAG: hypothetical protein WBO23_05540 [Burkholderiales bacterium]